MVLGEVAFVLERPAERLHAFGRQAVGDCRKVVLGLVEAEKQHLPALDDRRAVVVQGRGEPGTEPVQDEPVGNDEEEPVGNDEEEKVAEEISPRAALGRNDNEAALGRNDNEAALGRNDKSRKFWRVVLIVLCVLVGLLLIFVLLNRLAPGLLDPLLYSKEELQILRY